MDHTTLFLDTDCAETLTGHRAHGAAGPEPCGLPLEIVRRQTLPSTDGPVDHLHVQCPRGHRYTHVVSPAALPS